MYSLQLQELIIEYSIPFATSKHPEKTQKSQQFIGCVSFQAAKYSGGIGGLTVM